MVLFWFALLAISMLLYVLLDGFGLGIGMLFGLTRDDGRRGVMMDAVAPLWDGNETWLVVTGVVLWAAFPIVYSIVLSAFYLPLLLMLAGLILRGVAFEFRNKSRRLRWVWNVGFSGGSFLVAFVQGAAVGALVYGLPISHGRYVGGELGWFSPFALLCGIGLCVGYALLGATWLVSKCEGEMRASIYSVIATLALGILLFLVLVFGYALREHLPMLARWLERPFLFAFPGIGALAAIVLAVCVHLRREAPLFSLSALTFTAAFLSLAVAFWPYMIPFSITVIDAAAPHSSLAFMFWGAGLFVFPLMLIYTAISLRIFRGKVPTNWTSY